MHEWIDHTAELELRVRAASPTEVFEEAALALAELLGEPDPSAPAEVGRELTASAPDRPALLAAWLEELVFLSEHEGLVPVRVRRLELGEQEVEAELACRRGPARHLVKAVTYHGLRLEPFEEGWSASVVLDV